MSLKKELKQLKQEVENQKLEAAFKIKNEKLEAENRRKQVILKKRFDSYYNEIVNKIKEVNIKDENNICFTFRDNDERYIIINELNERFKKEEIYTQLKYGTELEWDYSGSYDKCYTINVCKLYLEW